MKFDDILKTYGKEKRQRVERNLYSLGNKLFGVDKWEFVDGYDSETSVSCSGNQYHVIVGKKALADNCNNEECNKAAYVLAVKDMYHEQRHVWQHTKAWNSKNKIDGLKESDRMTNIVRREFIKGYFPSVYYNNYSNDPSEMDAEAYGIKNTLMYFDSDPILDKNTAENILFQLMMSDDCIHKEMLGEHKDHLKSIYDVIDLFDVRKDEASDIKYLLTTDIPPEFKNEPSIDLKLTHEFLVSKRFREYRKAFDMCRTGIEQDKVLEQAILFEHPDVIRKSPLRLRKELLDCQRQMVSGILKSDCHAISPKHMRYSIPVKPSEIEKIELTEEDIADIPMNDSTINL